MRIEILTPPRHSSWTAGRSAPPGGPHCQTASVWALPEPQSPAWTCHVCTRCEGWWDLPTSWRRWCTGNPSESCPWPGRCPLLRPGGSLWPRWQSDFPSTSLKPETGSITEPMRLFQNKTGSSSEVLHESAPVKTFIDSLMYKKKDLIEQILHVQLQFVSFSGSFL